MGEEEGLLKKQEGLAGKSLYRELGSLVNAYKYLHWERWTPKGASCRNRGDRPEEQS